MSRGVLRRQLNSKLRPTVRFIAKLRKPTVREQRRSGNLRLWSSKIVLTPTYIARPKMQGLRSSGLGLGGVELWVWT